MKQQEFFKRNNRKSHGGTAAGKRKTARPLDPKRLHHVVMRSQHAVNKLSFKSLYYQTQLKDLIFEKAKVYGVRIAEFSNVGTHFHLLLKFQNRPMIQNFLRVVLGLIARIVSKAQKGKKFGKFWDALVFTRIISKGRDEARMYEYLVCNQIQAVYGMEARLAYQLRRKEIWKFWSKKGGSKSARREPLETFSSQLQFSLTL